MERVDEALWRASWYQEQMAVMHDGEQLIVPRFATLPSVRL